MTSNAVVERPAVEPPAVEPPLKLSEAILLGAMCRPQAFGAEFDESGVAACALACAIEAAGCQVVVGPEHAVAILPTRPPPPGCAVEEIATVIIPPSWMPVLIVRRECPDCGLEMVTSQLIPHLNDVHRWTRERIANRVEAWEREAEAYIAAQRRYALEAAKMAAGAFAAALAPPSRRREAEANLALQETAV